MAFRALVGKEFRELLIQTVFGLLLIIAVDLFLFSRISSWGPQAPFGLSTLLVQAVLLWTAISGQLSLHTEWGRGTVHWLLAYPLSGWSKVSAKLLSGLTASILLLIVAGAGMTWIFLHTFGSELAVEWGRLSQAPGFYPLTARNLLWLIPIGILALADLYLLGHLSYAVGRTVHKASWLVNGAVYFGLAFFGPYLIYTYTPINQISYAPLYVPSVADGTAQMVAIPAPVPAFLTAAFTVFVVLFSVSGWLLERRSEV